MRLSPRTGRWLLIGLLIGLVVSLWRTVSVGHQQRAAVAAYDKSQQLVSQLEDERAHLNGELVSARQTIEEQEGAMGHLKTELRDVQNQLEETSVQLASLQSEHEDLQQEHAVVSAKLDSLQAEQQVLEARLSSLRELRLAIRDVKQNAWQQRLAAWRARIESQKDADQEELASGNRGFVVRQGIPTLGSGPRLHVHVLEPESQ